MNVLDDSGRTMVADQQYRVDSPEIPVVPPSANGDDYQRRNSLIRNGPTTRSRSDEPKINGFYMIKQKDGTLARGEVLSTRNNTRTKCQEYFVHYEGQNRRLDEWIGAERFSLEESPAAPVVHTPLLRTLSVNDDKNVKKLTRSARRIHDEINHVQPSIEDMDCTLAAMERLHEERTKVKYIDRIIFGRFDIDAWYYSPFPAEYEKQEILYICEYCMKYMKYKKTYDNHKCDRKCPPGRPIYQKDNISIFEVDGKENKIYCQCLCLLSKLFLDHKTLYFDVDSFMFYILTETDADGIHVVGYFSKEKDSMEGNNLACIMTLPPYQRKGYGKFLIGFSYELSKREKLIGSPEKPLSDLGKLSYRSYWSWVLLEILKDASTTLSIRELSQMSCISEFDIIDTLQSLNLCKYWRGQHVLVVTPKIVKQCLQSAEFQPPKLLVDPKCLIPDWKPPPRLPRPTKHANHQRNLTENAVSHVELLQKNLAAVEMETQSEPDHEAMDTKQDVENRDDEETDDADSDMVFEGDVDMEAGWDENSEASA